MAKHGDFFPEGPRNVDELLDSLAKRAAAAQRMLNSMTAEQRAELMELSQQAFGSPELMEQLGRMDDNLRALRPGEDWDGGERFEGGEGLGLGDGTGALQDVADLDELADQLSQSYGGARLDDVDLDKLARQLGDEAAVDARTLQQLEQALRDSGYLRRGTDGDLRLSPKAMRQLGKSLLRDVAERMSGRQGQRDVRQAGAAGEPSAPPGPGRSATPSRGTSPAPSPTPCCARRGAGLEPGSTSSSSGSEPSSPAARSTTSRCRRPRRARRPAWRCWSTRRSRWRWTAVGCR